MKSPFLRWAGIFSLLAVSGYVAFSALPLFRGLPETAVLYTDTVRETAPVYGVFIRQEHILPPGAAFSHLQECQRIPGKISGIFTRSIDGYEHLTPPGPDPEKISSLHLDKRLPQRSPGKLITGSAYEFWAIADAPSAEKLTVGQKCTLETDQWSGVELTLTEKVKAGEFYALGFYGDRDMDTVMYLRFVHGQLHLGSHSGLRIPDGAVREQQGEHFTETVILGQTEKVPLSVLFDGEGFKLISSPQLYEGSEVIIDKPEELLP